MIEPQLKIRVFRLVEGGSTSLEIEFSEGKFVGAMVKSERTVNIQPGRVWLQPAEAEALRDLLVQEIPR